MSDNANAEVWKSIAVELAAQLRRVMAHCPVDIPDARYALLRCSNQRGHEAANNAFKEVHNHAQAQPDHRP